MVTKIGEAKRFVFLRHHRHGLLDEAFQQELASLDRKAERGQPPIAPAVVALALMLKASTGVSDDEVIEASRMDWRWQLALDGLDGEHAPLSKGILVVFRQRLIAPKMDWRLIERTIEIANLCQECGPPALRAALASSPLGSAGRVEEIVIHCWLLLILFAVPPLSGAVVHSAGRSLVASTASGGVVLTTEEASTVPVSGRGSVRLHRFIQEQHR